MSALKAGPRAPTWLVVVLVLAALGVAAYFGYNYWFAKLPELPPPPN